jgi:hypothetical protein
VLMLAVQLGILTILLVSPPVLALSGVFILGTLPPPWVSIYGRADALLLLVIVCLILRFSLEQRGRPVWPPITSPAVATVYGAALTALAISTVIEPQAALLAPHLRLLGVVVGLSALLHLTRDRVDARRLGRSVVLVCLALACTGIVERVTGTYFFSGVPGLFETTDRSGIRAQAWTQHPLILAMFCVIGALLAYAVFRGVVRHLLALVLLAGAAATESRIVLVLVAALVFLALIRRSRAPITLLTAAGVCVVVGLFVLPIPTLPGAQSLEDVSTAYRFALFGVLLGDLWENPLGHGLGGLQPGEYALANPFGVMDVSMTIDNSFLFLGTLAGPLGVLAAALFALRTVVDWRTGSTGKVVPRLAILIFAVAFSIPSFTATITLAVFVFVIGGNLAAREPTAPEIPRGSRGRSTLGAATT